MHGPLRIGLTGGIGSGKSTVAACLEALGADVIDTDAIARQLSEAGGAAIPDLRASFGDEFIDPSGALDRPRMRALAFSDHTARIRLEAILHPLIAVQTRALAEKSKASVLVFDVPLLVESGRWRQQVDEVWVVDCPADTQVSRVMRRSGWTEDAVRAVIGRQAARTQRRAAADLVISNDTLSRAELGDLVALALDRRLRAS